MTRSPLPDFGARLKAFEGDLVEIPQVRRGKVWCHQCGREEAAGVECFRTGWPKCCGQTMSLNSPEERAEQQRAALEVGHV